jgi:hypothetical protein
VPLLRSRKTFGVCRFYKDIAPNGVFLSLRFFMLFVVKFFHRQSAKKNKKEKESAIAPTRRDVPRAKQSLANNPILIKDCFISKKQKLAMINVRHNFPIPAKKILISNLHRLSNGER